MPRTMIPATTNRYGSFSFRTRAIWLFAAGLCSVLSCAQTSTSIDNNSPAITLTPAVISVHARPGQSFSQQLTIWNNTTQELRFHLQAADIVVRDGKRVFVPSGELEGGIARYAVFTDSDVLALPGASASTLITVTIPDTAVPRAIAALFVGQTPLAAARSLGMTASLGALVTFVFKEDFKLQNDPVQVTVDTDAHTLSFRQKVKNVGSDPIVPKGVVAVTSDTGRLIARLPVAGQRLLPGESSDFTAERAGLPRSGHYKVVFLLEHEKTLFTNKAEFVVE